MIAKQTKTGLPTTQTTLLLIWLIFLATENRSEHSWKKGIFIFVKNIVLNKNWFVVSIFHEFPEHHMEKQCPRHLQFQIHYFQNFLVAKCLRKGLSNKQSFIKATSAFLFWVGIFPGNSIKNPFTEIKKQLMLINFTLVIQMITKKILMSGTILALNYL